MIGIRSHVYKGFPLFVHFYTVYISISVELVGPSYFSRHSKVIALKSMQPEERSASGPMFIRGFPSFVHFYTVYTPISVELVGPSYFGRHSKLRPLKSMQPEERSASGPMFIRGFPSFAHFYTVYTPIFASLRPNIFQSARFPLIGIRAYVYKGFPLFVHFYTVYIPISVELIGQSYFSRHSKLRPLKSMQPEERSASGPMFIRGFPYSFTFTLSTPPFL